jgi:hypothetical protein
MPSSLSLGAAAGGRTRQPETVQHPQASIAWVRDHVKHDGVANRPLERVDPELTRIAKLARAFDGLVGDLDPFADLRPGSSGDSATTRKPPGSCRQDLDNGVFSRPPGALDLASLGQFRRGSLYNVIPVTYAKTRLLRGSDVMSPFPASRRTPFGLPALRLSGGTVSHKLRYVNTHLAALHDLRPWHGRPSGVKRGR